MTVKVEPRSGHPDVPAEIIQQSIVELAEGMKKLRATRLRDETIVTLLHSTSGVAKRDIKTILAHLGNLENLFLKPEKR